MTPDLEFRKLVSRWNNGERTTELSLAIVKAYQILIMALSSSG